MPSRPTLVGADSLRPGDCLLYRPAGVWSTLIAVKTWHWVSHCEAYIGDFKSVASRDGKGVGHYDLRVQGLNLVCRPKTPVDIDAAWDWFLTVDGQPYDWAGLSRFLLAGRAPFGNNGKMFCSEFLTRFYRAGGYDPFNEYLDADAVAPCNFLYSNLFEQFTYEPLASE